MRGHQTGCIKEIAESRVENARVENDGMFKAEAAKNIAGAPANQPTSSASGALPLYHKRTKRRVDLRSIREGALSLRDGRLQAPQIAPFGLYHTVSLLRFILKNDNNCSEALLC